MVLANAAIGLSILAMLLWGVSDFLVQKSSRKLGDWETLFVLTLFGVIILIPFVLRTLPAVLADREGLYILLGSAVFLTVSAILEIESFRRGKMSVVEPMLPFEIPAASILAFTLLGDRISPLQILFIILLITGLFLVSFRGRILSLRYFAERGVFMGLLGAALMGTADFLLGWGSRVTDPLTANFVLNVVMAFVAGVVLLSTGQLKKTIRDVKANRGLMLIMSLGDNIA